MTLPPDILTAYQARASELHAAGKTPPPVDQPWGSREVAVYCGVLPDTVKVYRLRAAERARQGRPRPGDLPAPDGSISGRAWWHPATIIDWYAHDRPGRGAGGGPHPTLGPHPRRA